MAKRRIRSESLDNMENVMTAKKPEVKTDMNVVMADAVIQHEKNDKHMKEVEEVLNDAAEKIENKEDVKKEVEAKLIFDESLEDFENPLIKEEAPAVKDGRSRKVYDDDGEDEYLDYDMFDFIYGLVTDCWPKPTNPLNHRMTKFLYIGSDKYMDSEDKDIRDASDGHAQVASKGDAIEVYANDVAKFKDIEEVCKLYKFKYSGPKERRNSNTYWKYSFEIKVPCVSSGYPYMVEDYFETIGKTLEDVMPADFCKQYRKRQAKIDAEVKKYLDEAEVKKILNKAITKAAVDNSEPLETHLDALFKELDNAGLSYQKLKIKKEFMNAFDDE